MPRVSIPYGKRQIAIDIPDANFCEVLYPNAVEFPADESVEIRRAIENPIGTPDLEELAFPGCRVAILCDDISRPTPTDRILPILLDKLHRAGVSDDRIVIIMALGSHRPMTAAEIDKKVGRQIRERIAVFNSEFRDKTRLVELGIAPGGVRVWADKRAVAADIRIGLGSIVPHPAVGWSGGAKIIYPGITGEETVATFHLQHGRVPWNMWGSDKSPVRQDMERWVDTVGLHFIVNVVCTPRGRIYKAVVGHYIKAHRAGVEYAKHLFGVKARGRVEIAIVSSYPADWDFWQAGKGLVSGDFLVKDGGTLVLVTPCPEGVGPHPDFMRLVGRDDIESLLDQTKSALHAGGDPLAVSVAAATARIRKRVRVALVSEGLSSRDATEAGFIKFSSVELALADALASHGPSARISVLPYGGEVYPMVSAQQQ